MKETNEMVTQITNNIVGVWGRDKLIKSILLAVMDFIIGGLIFSNNPEETTNDILEGED